MGNYIDAAQHKQLLAPINQRRVGRRDGMSHLEAYDVRAHLTRIFGFGRWSGDVIDVTQLFEEKVTLGNGKPGYRVGYRCTYRLAVSAPDGTVLATYTEAATGDGSMPESKRADAHDFALKTAESQALKRCAINLGDQFGLSLYNQGSVAALVGRTLVGPLSEPANTESGGTQNDDTDVTEHITTQLAPEDSPAREAEPETSTPPPVDTPPGQAADEPDLVDSIRERALAATKQSQLMPLFKEATAANLTGAPTTDGNGKGMTLETFLMARVKDVAA